MSTCPNTQETTQLHAALRAALQKRHDAELVWQGAWVLWGRGLASDADVDKAAAELDAAQAEVDRIVDSPAVLRIGAR